MSGLHSTVAGRRWNGFANGIVTALAAALLVVAAAPAGAQRTAAGTGNARAWLGFGIACGPCSLHYTSADRSSGVWDFSSPPVVVEVTPNGPAARAGLAVGDTLVAIDGVRITTDEGGRRFAAIRAGVPVRLTWHRAGNTGISKITPVAPSAAVAASGNEQSLERALVAQESLQAARRLRLDSTQYQAARVRMAQAERELRAQAAQLKLQQAQAARVQAAADSAMKRNEAESQAEMARVRAEAMRVRKEAAQAYAEQERVIAARAHAVGASQFTGTVAGADIEVRGRNVHVSKDGSNGTLVIRGDSLTVVVRPSGGSR